MERGSHTMSRQQFIDTWSREASADQFGIPLEVEELDGLNIAGHKNKAA